MAYLNIEELKNGKSFTTTYINGVGEEVTLYAYIDHDGDIRVTRDKGLNGGGKNLRSLVLLLDTWEEYIPERKVYLTDKGLELMELSDIGFKFSSHEDYQMMLEAIENSTDIKWNHGDNPTEWSGYNQYLVVSLSSCGTEQALYWGVYRIEEKYPTIHVENSKGWLFKYE